MSERNTLWKAFWFRWISTSLLALLTTYMYNGSHGGLRPHVMWVVHFAWWGFWITQAIHILFLLMMAPLIVLSHKAAPTTERGDSE